MPKFPNQRPIPPTHLRSMAEERLRKESPDLAGLSPGEAQEALHDLHVHRIELEMQNDQLRITQAELEAARERYMALYDYAPVSYLTVTERGFIRAANLTSVNMLGIERSRLVGLPLSQ